MSSNYQDVKEILKNSGRKSSPLEDKQDTPKDTKEQTPPSKIGLSFNNLHRNRLMGGTNSRVFDAMREVLKKELDDNSPFKYFTRDVSVGNTTLKVFVFYITQMLDNNEILVVPYAFIPEGETPVYSDRILLCEKVNYAEVGKEIKKLTIDYVRSEKATSTSNITASFAGLRVIESDFRTDVERSVMTLFVTAENAIFNILQSKMEDNVIVTLEDYRSSDRKLAINVEFNKDHTVDSQGQIKRCDAAIHVQELSKTRREDSIFERKEVIKTPKVVMSTYINFYYNSSARNRNSRNDDYDYFIPAVVYNDTISTGDSNLLLDNFMLGLMTSLDFGTNFNYAEIFADYATNPNNNLPLLGAVSTGEPIPLSKNYSSLADFKDDALYGRLRISEKIIRLISADLYGPNSYITDTFRLAAGIETSKPFDNDKDKLEIQVEACNTIFDSIDRLTGNLFTDSGLRDRMSPTKAFNFFDVIYTGTYTDSYRGGKAVCSLEDVSLLKVVSSTDNIHYPKLYCQNIGNGMNERKRGDVRDVIAEVTKNTGTVTGVTYLIAIDPDLLRVMDSLVKEFNAVGEFSCGDDKFNNSGINSKLNRFASNLFD